ncbi:MAG TPA: hypothetical protein VMQ73_08610 [Methylomirabilota bacterium]|nr:hypothetical protein [Methylomirabilota bacterium]
MGADYYILEAEKSAELITAFRLLAETGEDGERRFAPDPCRAVERAIACRTYASVVLELCHLSRAASAYRGRYFDLFWAPGEMRAGRLRALFAECRAAGGGWLHVGPGGVELTYPDGTFAVSYSRMPVLVALADFLLTALGFAVVDEILAPLGARGVTVARVSQQANALSRAVYDYLKQHLPPLQAQRKLGSVVDFLSARHGGDFDAAMVDDASVLDFWRSALDDPGRQDFRTFASVFLAFARFRQVFEQAATLDAVEHALPIGPAAEDGEVDPAQIAAVVETGDAERNPLDELQTPPSSCIKFFNAKERACIAFFFQCGGAVDALPLSFLRCEVFGGVQARLSQSLRTGLGSALEALIAGGPADDYRRHRERLGGMAEHARTMLLAAAYVMHKAGMRQVAHMAQRRHLALAGGTLDLPPAPTADAFLAEAREAARHVARQGFRPADTHDEEIKAGFIAGCPLVATIAERLEGFVGRLAKLRLPEGDWDAQFDADKLVFDACFRSMYGVPR